MSGLQFLIQESPGGKTLLDASAVARGLRFSGNRNGFVALTCTLDINPRTQYWLYDRPGWPHGAINWNGLTVWEGRLEDVAPSMDGLRAGLFGYQRALSDLPYTGMFSYSRYDKWRTVTNADVASRAPGKYALDNNGRLNMGLRKNETYANNNEAADWTFSAPHNGSQNIYLMSFDYGVLLPANWSVALQSFAYDFTSITSEWSLAATGVLQTGSVTQTLAANKDRVDFRIVNSTGAPYNYAGETDANYARITNLRVKGTTSAGVYADEIAREFIGVTNALNSGQLSSDTNLVRSPAVDLQDEFYEDADMREALDRFAIIGDGTNQYEWGVWAGRRLRFQQRGYQAPTWYVDVAQPELERTLEAMRNSTYATYKEPRGSYTLRTATNSDAFSVLRYGGTRRDAVDANTTSATQAAAQRDAALADRKTPIPRVALTIERLYDAAGQQYPPWLLQTHHTVVIRNISPALTTDIDRVRRFRVDEYEYDADTGTMRVVPESPPPTLDVMLARQAATR